MHHKIIILIIFALAGQPVLAQTESADSTKTQALKEIVVEAQLQSTSATVSTYIPTSKQKNSSQTATELLNRMALPQLSLGMGNSIVSKSLCQ